MLLILLVTAMNQYEKPKPMKNAERYDDPGIFFLSRFILPDDYFFSDGDDDSAASPLTSSSGDSTFTKYGIIY